MYSVQIAVSDGTLTRIALSIEYFEKDDITLYRNLELTPLVLGTDWQWDGDTHINLLTGIPVPAGSYITVRRNTNIGRAFNIYDGGAAFSRETLDENFRQMIYLAQEFTEGNGLTGLYFPLDMHGFQIKNLGDGTAPGDAVNKGQLDVVDAKVEALENSFVTDTVSYPWYTVATTETDTFSPGFAFTKAAVYLNGICQTPDYSYIVVSNQILLADPVPVGTMVFARLGEDVQDDDGFATTAQLSAVQLALENDINAVASDVSTKAESGANSDITSLSGLTTVLSVAQGGTGAATVPAARTALGAAASAVNADITSLTGLTGGITGITTGTAATAGVVGQEVSVVTSSAVTLTTAVLANVTSVSIPAGDWEINCNLQLMNSAAVTSRSFGVSATSGALPTNWYERYSTTANLTAGTTNIAGTTYRLLLAAPTTVYLVANIAFAGTCTAQGHIRARRMR